MIDITVKLQTLRGIKFENLAALKNNLILDIEKNRLEEIEEFTKNFRTVSDEIYQIETNIEIEKLRKKTCSDETKNSLDILYESNFFTLHYFQLKSTCDNNIARTGVVKIFKLIIFQSSIIY